jgi:hypothetical protein
MHSKCALAKVDRDVRLPRAGAGAIACSGRVSAIVPPSSEAILAVGQREPLNSSIQLSLPCRLILEPGTLAHRPHCWILRPKPVAVAQCGSECFAD